MKKIQMVTFPTFLSLKFHINIKTNVEFPVDRGEEGKKGLTFLCGKRLSSECGAYEI
jgi:hypothetical protein